MTLLVLLYLMALVGALALYNAYLLLDTRTPDDTPEDLKIKRRWHALGAVVFALVAGGGWALGGAGAAVFALALFWGPFAGIVHAVALGKPFFFVGTTAHTDRALRAAALFLTRFRLTRRTTAEALSAVVKIGALLFSILLLLWEQNRFL